MLGYDIISLLSVWTESVNKIHVIPIIMLHYTEKVKGFFFFFGDIIKVSHSVLYIQWKGANPWQTWPYHLSPLEEDLQGGNWNQQKPPPGGTEETSHYGF